MAISRDLEKSFLELSQDVYILQRDNKEVIKEIEKINEELAFLTNDVEVLKRTLLEKDEKVEHFNDLLDSFKISDYLFDFMSEQEIFNIEIKLRMDECEAKLKEIRQGVSRSPELEEIMGTQKEPRRDYNLFTGEILNLNIGSCLLVVKKTVEELVRIIATQLEIKEDDIVYIKPEVDLDRRLRWKGCSYKLIQEKVGTTMLIFLSVLQPSSETAITPSQFGTVLFCIVDEASNHVLFYMVGEARTNTKHLSKVRTIIFGPFKVDGELHEELKSSSRSNKLRPAFIIFQKIEGRLKQIIS